MKLREAIAEVFLREGVSTLFTLMGDGNMDWSVDMDRRGTHLVHARHEHAAVAMADGYARALPGEVGVASVTHGPGVTQLGTALAVAARNRTPMVVFVGDTAIDAAYHVQEFDPGPFVRSTGAEIVEVRTVGQALTDTREAFRRARVDSSPVVLSIPVDLQETEVGDDLEALVPPPLTPRVDAIPAHPDAVTEVADLLEGAERPVIVAGRGAKLAGAKDAIVALAERTGALLANSLEAIGIFDGEDADMGVCGGYTHRDNRPVFARADLVIGVGARMGRFTTDGAKLFGDAHRVQIDLDPVGYVEGIEVADTYVRGDARLTVEAIDAELDRRGVTSRTGFRTAEVLAAIADRTPDVEIHDPALEEGTLDPRHVAAEVNRLLGDDALVVLACGHFWYFLIAEFSGRGAESYVMAYHFAAIGQGISTAIGVAVARPDKRVVLFEGDGSFLMHVQELETIRRQGIEVLSVLFNDGAYGAEVHKMSAYRGDGSPAVFGRPDLAAIAEGFGVTGHTVTALDELAGPMKAFDATGESAVIDVHTSVTVISESYRRLHHGET